LAYRRIDHDGQIGVSPSRHQLRRIAGSSYEGYMRLHPRPKDGHECWPDSVIAAKRITETNDDD
jgi:hypothetical protein